MISVLCIPHVHTEWEQSQWIQAPAQDLFLLQVYKFFYKIVKKKIIIIIIKREKRCTVNHLFMLG